MSLFWAVIWWLKKVDLLCSFLVPFLSTQKTLKVLRNFYGKMVNMQICKQLSKQRLQSNKPCVMTPCLPVSQNVCEYKLRDWVPEPPNQNPILWCRSFHGAEVFLSLPKWQIWEEFVKYEVNFGKRDKTKWKHGQGQKSSLNHSNVTILQTRQDNDRMR